MSNKSEALATRRAALGLRVISSDLPTRPLMRAASEIAAKDPVLPQSTVLDTSLAHRNHCGSATNTGGDKPAVSGNAGTPYRDTSARNRFSLVSSDS